MTKYETIKKGRATLAMLRDIGTAEVNVRAIARAWARQYGIPLSSLIGGRNA